MSKTLADKRKNADITVKNKEGKTISASQNKKSNSKDGQNILRNHGTDPNQITRLKYCQQEETYNNT